MLEYLTKSLTKSLIKSLIIRNWSQVLLRRFGLKVKPLMDLSTAKRFCHESNESNGEMKVGTHDGVFHCDEVLACYLLKQLPQYKNANIIRTRNENTLKDCDIVVDVGGVYDHSTHRYDHHQKTFSQTLSSLLPNKQSNIKLSSAGLVFAHFGHQIIAHLLDWDRNDDKTDVIFDKVYENFVQEIDAIDNGVSICEGEPNYRITTNISSRVANLVPHWNESSNNDILFERFRKGIDLVGEEFKDRVNYYGKVWWPARQLLSEAIDSRFDVDKSGEIIELKQVIPWKEHLFLLEKEIEMTPKIKFVIFSDTNGKWRVQSVPISSHSFELRVPLFIDWRGLRDKELSESAQIDDCIFVHSSGFIGGNDTRQGVIQMAKKTLKLLDQNTN